MSYNREKIINSLTDKNVMIWGARMTGIGALRHLIKKKIKVLNFIDSDDALVGKFVHEIKVYHPNQLHELINNHKNVIILIAVSLKESEILRMILQGMGTKEIANANSIRLNTVSTYKMRIFEKFNVKNLVELMQIVKQNNMYDASGIDQHSTQF